MGFANRCYSSRDDMMAAVLEIARSIAAKSPLAIRGTKEMLLYTRDHSVAESLKYMAIWNAALLQSEDFNEAFAAFREKRAPKFRN
jgi:enoyl-CoA hydratase